MKKCDKCRAVFTDEYVFCPTCGSRLIDIPQDSEMCSNCGAVIKKGLVFCPMCGNRLGQSTKPEPAVNRAPEPVARTPEPVAHRAPEPPARTPEPVARRAPEPPARTPEPAVRRAPEPPARTPEPAVRKAPEPAARTPEHVAHRAPEPPARTPEPAVRRAPEPAARTPEPAVRRAPEPVARTPEPAVYRAPEPAARTPEPVAHRAPEPPARTPEPAVRRAPEPPARTPEPAVYRAPEPMQVKTGTVPASPDAAQVNIGTVPAATDAAPAAIKTLPGKFTAKDILKNKKIVIAGILVAFVIVGAALAKYSSPRPLNINTGEKIEAYFNQPEMLFVYPEGLFEECSNEVEWTFDHPTLTTIKDGMITVTYDKDAFNASREAAMYGDDDSTFTTTIHGKLKRGLRNWEGEAQVVVSLQEPFYINGMTYVEPAASKDSYFDVTASKEYSTYIYLKSKTDPANDISFIVDKGTQQMVPVPCDTYEVFEASGLTWYGPDILFGPNTYYSKSGKTVTFTSESYWTLEIGVIIGGNTTSIDINSSDFPDSETEGV